jgi:hypothetical protein
MNLSAPDPVQRYQAVDLTPRWANHAAAMPIRDWIGFEATLGSEFLRRAV